LRHKGRGGNSGRRDPGQPDPGAEREGGEKKPKETNPTGNNPPFDKRGGEGEKFPFF